MTVTRKWTLLAAVLAVAVLVGGWFLLVAPKRSEAAALRGDVASQERANADLEQEIQQLQAQQAELPKQRALLATLQKQIPDNPALPTLVRNLTAASRKVGAQIDSLQPTLPEPAVALQAAPAAATSSASTSSADAGSDGTATTSGSTTTVAQPPAPSLYRVPLTVKVTGSYFELEQFVNRLEGLKRSFLVTGFTIGEADSEQATPGDITIELKGRVFLSPPVSAATTTTTPVATGTAPAGQ